MGDVTSQLDLPLPVRVVKKQVCKPKLIRNVIYIDHFKTISLSVFFYSLNDDVGFVVFCLTCGRILQSLCWIKQTLKNQHMLI